MLSFASQLTAFDSCKFMSVESSRIFDEVLRVYNEGDKCLRRP